jgi:hypothetical protein
MGFAFLGIVAFFFLMSMLGFVADSRDGADWQPTSDGMRRARRL